MRILVIALAAMSLAGCMKREDEPAKVKATPAAITFAGANAADAAGIVKHGERVATVIGCNGCHGRDMQGSNVTAGDPDFGDMNASNITLALASYDDAALDKLIRHGVPKDGRQLWFMPAESLQYVSDADTAALIAYLRTLKPAGKPMPPLRKGAGFERDVKAGMFGDTIEMVRRFKESQPTDLGPSHALGRYIAMTGCTECHNSKLQGYPEFTPDLDIAGSYSSAELTTLLTTGEGKGKRNLGLMTEIVKGRYASLTPAERAALVGYIKARVDRPQ